MQHSWRKVNVWKKKGDGMFELRETFLVLATGPAAAVDLVAGQMGYTPGDYTGSNPQAILRDEGVTAHSLRDLLSQ